MPENTYNPEVDADKMIDAKTLDAALRRYFVRTSNPSWTILKKDRDGVYINSTIAAWLDAYSDGEVYGIRDFGQTIAKTGANAGLVLEPSTTTESGRNDYRMKKLFMCPRCNGRVDEHGMPVVTAIEHIDSSFTAERDTFVITPIYWWRMVTGVDQVTGMDYCDWQYCDSDMSGSGYSMCDGALTEEGQVRPFILRACYMTSTQSFDSKAGVWPATAGWFNNGVIVSNSLETRLTQFMSAQLSNGLCGFSAADASYMIEFQRLMLGTNSIRRGAMPTYQPRTSSRFTATQPDDGTLKVTCSTGRFIVGETIAMDSNGTMVPIGTVQSVIGATGQTAIVSNLKSIDPVDAQGSVNDQLAPWINGCLDGVLGTYGSFAEDPSEHHYKHPFRFQNMEWGNTLTERVYNVLTVHMKSTGDNAVWTFPSYTAMSNDLQSARLAEDTAMIHLEQGRAMMSSRYTHDDAVRSTPMSPLVRNSGLPMLGEYYESSNGPFSTLLQFENESGWAYVLDFMKPKHTGGTSEAFEYTDFRADEATHSQGYMVGCRASTLGKSMDSRTHGE